MERNLFRFMISQIIAGLKPTPTGEVNNITLPCSAGKHSSTLFLDGTLEMAQGAWQRAQGADLHPIQTSYTFMRCTGTCLIHRSPTL